MRVNPEDKSWAFGAAMVRNAKKKALYEVIIRAKSKTDYEQLHPKLEPVEMAEQQAPQDVADIAPPSVVRWVRKPRIVQFNAGRIEFSMPYQVGIAVLLAALLVLVVVFRLGERVGSRENTQLIPVNRTSAQVKQEIAPAKETVTEQTASQGRNRIVIQMYQVREQLVPVKEYFDKLGVATEIVERNNWYYLVTKNGYDNPDKPGTDGYLAKQKIIELGAGYKAPTGYETFRKADGTAPFNDAFGIKFE
ncbi:MAG: hypothetical protein ABII09_09920 [Planctomycetota bacterium]